MTAAYGMMAMMPFVFASAGYVLVSSEGTAEWKGHKPNLLDRLERRQASLTTKSRRAVLRSKFVSKVKPTC
jgi:hypothetical protein